MAKHYDITEPSFKKIILNMWDSWFVREQDLDYFITSYNNEIKPELVKSYLAHVVNAIENIINEELKNHYIEEQLKLEKKDRKSFYGSGRRYFTISLVAKNNIPKKRALVDIKDEYAAIYYDSSFSIDEIRLFIAHELGHIYCHKISKLKPSGKTEEELFANIFALIAMVDRNYFYEKKYSKYSNRNATQIVNDIKNKIGLLGNI